MVRRARRVDRQDGFTLIEVMVAMFITTIVMTALIYAVVASLTTIQQARQRQTATALATQQLERLRAQPYDSVTQPNATAPCGTVSATYASSVSGSWTFAAPASLVPGGLTEPLVVNCVSGKTVDQLVGTVTYHVETYVSKPALTASGSQAFDLTAVVRWTSSVSRGERQLIQRSTTFSSTGCLSTANSPFAAPCQAYYTVRAGEALSGVTVSSATAPDQNIANMDARQLRLDFAHTSTNLLVEQTATGTAAAVTSGASRVAATTSTTGGQNAGASVDTDPSSVPGQSVTATTPAQTSATESAYGTTGTVGTLSLVPSSGDSGTAQAAVAALSTQCTNYNGNPLTTAATGSERPCATSTMQTSSGQQAKLTYTAPSGTQITLGAFGKTATPSRAVAALVGTTINAGVCSAGGTVDCGHAAARRDLSATIFGAPGTGTGPSAAYTGLFSVSGITESVVAEEGSGAGTPQVSRSGTVSVWQGPTTGYGTPLSLAAYASPADGTAYSVPIPTTSVSYPDGTSVRYESGSVTVQRPSLTRSPATRTGNVATDCKTTACSTSLSGGSVSAHVTVIISSGGVEVTRFAVTVDLGALTTEASYKAAANA